VSRTCRRCFSSPAWEPLSKRLEAVDPKVARELDLARLSGGRDLLDISNPSRALLAAMRALIAVEEKAAAKRAPLEAQLAPIEEERQKARAPLLKTISRWTLGGSSLREVEDASG